MIWALCKSLEFQKFVNKCRKMGITIPIMPGIMPIQSFGVFSRMTTLCKTKVPQYMHNRLAPVKENDKQVKDAGVELCIEQCKDLLSRGTPGLHFYTDNLESHRITRIIEGLGLVTDFVAARPLPWRPSPGDVRGQPT